MMPTKAMRELADEMGMRIDDIDPMKPGLVEFIPYTANEPNYLDMDAESLRDLAALALKVADELDAQTPEVTHG